MMAAILDTPYQRHRVRRTDTPDHQGQRHWRGCHDRCHGNKPCADVSKRYATNTIGKVTGGIYIVNGKKVLKK